MDEPRAPKLRDELLHLGTLDRDAHRRGGVDLALREANATRLLEVLLDHGWPGRSLVGEDGAEAAWLIALHADHDLSFQKLCAKLLREAVAAGDVPARHLAYVEDRLLVHDGKKQRYGTQVRATPEGVESFPVEDPSRLDERRAEVGLEPMEEYLREAAARAQAGRSLQP